MNLYEIDQEFSVEDTQYECKARLNRNDYLGWAKTVAGFANRHGGVLFVGVEDKTNRLIGFPLDEIDDEKQYFYRVLREHFSVLPEITCIHLPFEVREHTRYILKFIVSESESKPIILSDKGLPLIFMRRDGYTNGATIEEIYQMSLSSKRPRYDEQLTDIPYRREDFQDFFAFYKDRNEGREPTDKELESIGFFDSNGMLYQGAYMFSDHYEGNAATVVCSTFKGYTRGDEYVISSESYRFNFIRTYQMVEQYLEVRINHPFLKKENYRIDLESIPKRSIFEAMMNALAHRDYFLDGTQINVDLFVDRVVITSPGSFLGGEDIPATYALDAFPSRRRNKLICDILVFAKAMEAKGTGLEKISDDYKGCDAHHKPYLFSRNNQFTIVLPDLSYESGIRLSADRIVCLVPIENQSRFDLPVLSFCYGRNRSISEIAREVETSDSTYFRSLLKNLVSQGLLISSKKGNATTYRTSETKVWLK
ncbi:MAG: ATP-binding protein [Candidatus Enteromonas sp.]|nr:ATP-binding protein [Candidatus Enteromonas sp.]